MTGALAGSLVLAVGSSVAINWGYFAQHDRASRLPALALRHPVRSMRSLFADRRWLVGFVVGIGGWVLYVLALRLAPLSLVQAASAGGIGVLALLVHRRGGTPAGRELSGVAIAIGGLVLLGISLAGHEPHRLAAGHGSTAGVAIWIAGTGLAAAVFAGPLARRLRGGAGLGIAAGLCYAAGDVGTKAAVGGGAALLFAPFVLAAHGLGFVALQLGFQRGTALATAGVATLFTNAVPIAAGMVVFGDGIPAGPLGVARVAAFACVTLGAALLAQPGAETGKVNAVRPSAVPVR